MKRNIVAKSTHKRMVQDERFGYSWEERWGHTPEKWTVEGLTFTINVGDYDCSSSTITAWRKALTGTKWEHALDDASYTGNMKDVFLASGLFEWKPMSFIASPGDLYLNEENHVAMCQQQVPDELSEFSWGDNGAYGNKRGDQSGFESRVNPFYDYPWDGILHYNGKADNLKHTAPKSDVAAQPRYRIWRDGKWQAWHSNGSTAGYKGHPIYDVDFSGLPSGSWWRLTLKGGKVLAKNKHNDVRKVPISGIEVYYKTANPSKTGYYEALYRVYAGGEWLKWEHDVEDGGAGDDRNQVEKIQFKVAKR